MSNEQWKTGLLQTITNASQIVIGTASCDWANQVAAADLFKVNLDGESTFKIGSVVSATRIILAANYTGSTNSGLSYIIAKSFSINRGFYRVSQGDYDFADLLSQNTIDPIDEDIHHIMTGNATVDGTISTSFGIDTDGNCLRIKSTNLSASHQYHFPNYNASMAAKNASNDWTGNQKFDTITASDINATTGDINILHSGTLTVNDLNATTGDIETLHSLTFTASNVNASTGDINTLHSTTITASDLTASIGDIHTLHVNTFTASTYNALANAIASITTNIGNISRNASDIIVANASINALQANPVLKTSDYQILTSDTMILASGNVTITLASASSKHGIRIGNRSLDANASTLVKKSGGDTIEGNASLNLANKYDTVYLIGDGTNTHFQF